MKRTSQFWRYLTCRQRSTWSTMRYYSDAYISDTVSMTLLHWFESHLCGRRQLVRRTPKRPLLPWSLALFLKDRSLDQYTLIYTPDLIRIIERQGLLPHLFADDTRKSTVAVYSVEWRN